MNFVDDIDLETATSWGVDRVFQKLTHFVNPGIGGGVDLKQINKTTAINLLTGRT